ncbi:hypothetical protein AAHE18_18G147800 [Arachis hypogaea]
MIFLCRVLHLNKLRKLLMLLETALSFFLLCCLLLHNKMSCSCARLIRKEKARKVTGCSCIVVKVRRMGSKETALIVMHEEYKILKCYKNDRSSSQRAIYFL